MPKNPNDPNRLREIANEEHRRAVNFMRRKRKEDAKRAKLPRGTTDGGHIHDYVKDNRRHILHATKGWRDQCVWPWEDDYMELDNG